MLNEPLDSSAAKGLIRDILSRGSVSMTAHARKEMANDRLTRVDVVNVLRAGLITEPAEFENGSWRYRVRTNRIVVVIAFRSEKELVVVTAWRIQR